MIYFTVRKEIEHMRSILNNFERIAAIEKTTRDQLRDQGAKYLGPYGMFQNIREVASKTSLEYQELRVTFAKMIPRANEICAHEKISWYKQGRAAMIEGGMPFQGSIFEFVLNRPSDIMDLDTDIRDTINQTIGVLERKETLEFRNLVNPFYWLIQAIIFIVRLPYNILRISGFNTEKIEEYFIARLFQLLYVIVLILVLTRFGLASAIDLTAFLVP